ncbi:M56 family metallopeptidase [Lutimonas zeaxanthinifaciens]|uniref:M56 family metallopeptidase n=1 Tax=Lutimonas zeaxanthinifaciens TaxID=3060215 RepID=UPI00265CE2E2|nr:energy transducer TonB [Lutimonas sp. YSD2104]WKK67324.1 energy transducer TonB [Lutimonas sp. YSD2104]
MSNYIFQVILFQAAFYMVYEVFLKKETFFQWNRFYLILTSIIAYIIPVLKIEKIANSLTPEYAYMLPEIIYTPGGFIERQFNWSLLLMNSMSWIIYTGIIFSGILFAVRIYKLYRLIQSNKKRRKADHCLVILKENHTAFSFFNFIFISETNQSNKKIIDHELIHVKELHSIDLLLFEIQKIAFWFNPFTYIYQKNIATIHEFIADSRSVSKSERSTFFNSLLAETFKVDRMTFVNSFNNQSLIKKRIIMFNREHSKNLLKIKYIMLIPLLSAMLVYTSCEKNKAEADVDKNTANSAVLNYETQQNTSLAEQDETVPFVEVDQVPVFPGCEDAEDQKACMVKGITAHVSNNFDASLLKNIDNTESNEDGSENLIEKIYVRFTIDKEGNVTDMKAKTKHKELEQEVIKVVSDLPRFIPGQKNGKNVAVKFTLPILLKKDI